MAKRFMKPSIKWKEIENKVPPEQKGQFLAFKAKSDGYLRRVQAGPAELPKINWEEYKKTVPVEGLVDKLKSEYERFKVPYPEDKLSPEVDKQWAALQPEIKKYKEEMQAHIAKANKEITRINALPKYEDMTMEMFYDLHPDDAVDFVKKPSFWPHTPEEQLGYKDPTVKVEH